jgi:hypothetical protein
VVVRVRWLVVSLVAGCTCGGRSHPAADADVDADTDGDRCDVDSGSCAGSIGECEPLSPARHCAYDAGPDSGRIDCADVVYEDDPPSSGTHCPDWERDCGEHTETVDPCNWVHNLEHGWIVMLSNCPTGCDAELALMRQAICDGPVEADGTTRMLLTPDPDLGTRFALVSWGWVWKGDAIDAATLQCFVAAHYGQGPEFGGMPDAGAVDASTCCP